MIYIKNTFQAYLNQHGLASKRIELYMSIKKLALNTEN